MALPKSYLTSTKNVDAIFTAIQQGQAPKQFTTRFLEGLGFKGNYDRLMIGVLKSLKFLDDKGAPLQRYFEFLDQGQSGRVLAEAVREAYSDVYQLNNKAHDLSRSDIKGKMKTLTQGQYTDAVIDKMVGTFFALAKAADFEAAAHPRPPVDEAQLEDESLDDDQQFPSDEAPNEDIPRPQRRRAPVLGELVYRIEIQLPESRDPAVYDALFTSLRAHLLS